MAENNMFRKTVTDTDIENVIETITLAFRDDPSWAPLLVADQNDLLPSRKYWSLFVRSAARYPFTYQNDEGTVAAVWFPPASTELTAEEEANLEPLVLDLYGPKITSLLYKTYEGFDAATPEGDYYYLSLLGVHPSRRGEGLGMQLLRENLEEFDAQNTPTYLESSNSQNDRKYKSLGFEQHGTFLTGTGVRVNTFWRDPQ